MFDTTDFSSNNLYQAPGNKVTPNSSSIISNKFDVSISVYFRVRDAEIYGGSGSVGYMALTYHHLADPCKLTDSLAEALRQHTAAIHGIPADHLEFISFSEYQAHTEDPEDPEDPEDDENDEEIYNGEEWDNE